MVSTYEAAQLFRKINLNQSLADIIFMIDFVFPGEPFILAKDGSVFAGFEISGIEYESMEPSAIDDIEKEIRVLFELVKEDITFTNYFIRRRGGSLDLACTENAPTLVRFLQNKKQGFYNSLDKENFQSSILCTIRLNRPIIKKSNLSYFTRMEREFILPKQKILENVEKLATIYNLAKTSLKHTGFHALTHEEIFRYFYFIINGFTRFPRKKCYEISEMPPFRTDLSLNSQLSRSHITFNKDYYLVDDKLRRVIALVDEPPETERMFFRQFFDFKGNIVIKNSFSTVDTSKLKSALKSNYKVSKAMLFKKRLSGEYVSEYEEHELKLEKERQVPYDHQLSIMVEAENKIELNRVTDDIITKICKTGAYAATEKNYLPPAAVSFFPGQEQFNKRKKNILSSNVSNLFIKSKLSAGDNEPVEYFLDRSGNFYGLNPFSREDAPHMIISGSTGKGKSYLMIKLLLSFLAMDSRIIAIDKSLSYFFEVLQEINPENTAIMCLNKDRKRSGLRFNPFLPLATNFLKKVGQKLLLSGYAAGDVGAQHLNKSFWDSKTLFSKRVLAARGFLFPEEQMALCEGLLTIMIGQHVNQGNRYLIRASLEQFFEEYGEALQHSGPGRIIKPLDILITIIRDKFRDRNVEQAIQLWMEGERGEILNSGIDNFTDRKYCLFDLKGIEGREDIMRVVVYLIFHKIDRMISDETLLSIPKVFAIDEAKFYYDKEELSPFLDKYIRQGRKHNLCMISNFQSINDALQLDDGGNLTGWSKGLFENTQKFILFGRQLKIENALSALKLTDFQKELYESLDTVKREFLMVSKGGNSRVLTPVTGPWTNVIATSHPREMEYRNKLKAECGGNYIETIQRFVEITGASLDIDKRLQCLADYYNTST